MGSGRRTADRQRRLPLQLTRLFGREAEIAELLAEVDRARLVTLTGPPGCGKTRLAVECGARSASRKDLEVCWVELAPITAPMATTAVARTVGLAEAGGRPAEDMLVDHLAVSGETLLLLDNCEHVLEPVAGLVERVLTTCPALRVVATSRAPLELRGERVWNVRELDARAARAMFVDRVALATGGAGDADADAQDDAHDDEAVEAICAHLDRLPLAIELVAAWSRTLTPKQTVQRLTEGSPLLRGPGRGRPPRHATMAATVDWSCRLLPAPAQRLFERLSVFVAGFDLEAAQAVTPAGSDDDVLGSLASLVNHSLVVTDRSSPGRARYRMPEPVRQCAAARLQASEEHDAVRRRQADHYLRLSCGPNHYAYGGADPEVVCLMAQEESNVLALLEWARGQQSDLGLRLCDAMVAFWTSRGRADEGRALLAEMLAAGTPDPRLRLNCLTWAAQLAWRTGDYGKAHQLLDEALAFTRATRDTRGTAAALRTKGQVLTAEGDPETARALLHESLALSRSAGDEDIWSHVNLAWAHYLAGDLSAGDEEAWAVLRVGMTCRDEHRAIALFTLQYGALLRGDAAAQRRHLFEALAAMDEGGVLDRSDWLGCAAALAAREGRPRTALRALGGAAAVVRRRRIRPPRAIAASIAGLWLKAWDDVGRPLADRLFAQGETMTWDELVAAVRVEPGDEDSPLTRRESQVAQLVAEGCTNVDIARHLVLSRRTVDSHLDHIRRKLGFSNRHQIIAWVLEASPR